jgi:hypothetical protein
MINFRYIGAILIILSIFAPLAARPAQSAPAYKNSKLSIDEG